MKNHYDVVIPPYLAMPVAFPQGSQVQDWGHKYLRATEFYGKTRGENAVIFVLDTAGEFRHSDLEPNTLHQFAGNFTSTPGNMADEHGHGTHCAGIAAAVDNNIGVIGTAPDAKLVPVKVLNPNGGYNSWIAKGIRYCADVEMPGYESYARILSLSLGGSSGSPELEDAINYAIEKGCFVVVAAGNSGYTPGQNSILYPGRYEQVITVASIGKSEMPSNFSSGGAQVDVASPGEGVYSTHLNGGYAYLSGTSMATPMTAGMVALIVSHYPEIKTQQDLEAYLEQYAKDLHSQGEDDQTGAGAPVATAYLDNEPDPGEPGDPDNPGDPDDPTPPGPPRRELRELVFEMDHKPYPVIYRTTEETEFKRATLTRIRIAVETDYYSHYAFRLWESILDNFYQNRGYILLPNMDWEDAGFWAARFLEIIAGRINNVRVLEAEVVSPYGESAFIPAERFGQRMNAKALRQLPVRTLYLQP